MMTAGQVSMIIDRYSKFSSLKAFYFIVILLFFYTSNTKAQADTPNFKIVGSLGMTYKNYEYNIQSESLSGKYFSDSLPSLKYQVGLSSKNYSLSFLGDNTLDLGGATSVNPIFSENTTADFSRDDYAVQGTLNLNSKWSLGGGYRWMKTKANYAASENDEQDLIETYGPYINLAYGNRVSDRSSYILSLLLTSLSTDFTLSSTNQDYKFNFDGYGYGANFTWSHRLTQTSLLNLSAELHSYYHKDMKNSNTAVEDFSLEESTVATRVEYIKLFN